MGYILLLSVLTEQLENDFNGGKHERRNETTRERVEDRSDGELTIQRNERLIYPL